jgi:hypothetical protein
MHTGTGNSTTAIAEAERRERKEIGEIPTQPSQLCGGREKEKGEEEVVGGRAPALNPSKRFRHATPPKTSLPPSATQRKSQIPKSHKALARWSAGTPNPTHRPW